MSFGLPFLAHLMFCISTISNHGERTPKYLGTVVTNKKSSTSSWESEAHPQPLESCESKGGSQGGIWGGATLDSHHWSYSNCTRLASSNGINVRTLSLLMLKSCTGGSFLNQSSKSLWCRLSLKKKLTPKKEHWGTTIYIYIYIYMYMSAILK